MKIEEVISMVYDTRKEAIHQRQCDIEPKIRIYMDRFFWGECMEELIKAGRVSNAALEFFSYSTIMGYNVWQVSPTQSGREHPRFEVLCLDRGR